MLPWGTPPGDVLYPTQKPVEALLPLIAVYTAPSDVILDPFAGAGTTAVAAKQLQQRDIAIEMEPQHQATASHRLPAAVPV